MIFNALHEDRRIMRHPKAMGAVSNSIGHGLHIAAERTEAICPGQERSRRVAADEARALQTLEHAINYLTSDFADLKTGPILDPLDPRVDAVRILMLLSLEVYFACPVSEPWL